MDGPPKMDGQWHRVPVDGDKKGQDSGSYRGFLDGRPSGLATNYRAGAVGVKWVATGVALTEEQKARIDRDKARTRARRDADRKTVARDAAKTAYGIWTNLPADATPDTCPYLAEKGVQGHGVKVDDEGKLVVPHRDANGFLWGVQFVDDGKRFLKGAQKQGTMHLIGGETAKLADLGSNEARSSSARATPPVPPSTRPPAHPVVVAFDSGNLKPVAEAVRAAHPDRDLIPRGRQRPRQHSRQRRDGKGGGKPPRRSAAARSPLSSTTGKKAAGLTDFNDLAKARGPQAVARTVNGALGWRQTRSVEQERGIA